MTSENITIELTITGSAQEISRTVKSIFTKPELTPVVKTLNTTITQKPVVSKKSMRSQIVADDSYKTKPLKGENLKLATTYVKHRNRVRFTDLIQHIIKNNSTSTSPSSAQLAKFLTKKNFKKFKFILADNTTFIAWERD